LLRTRLLRTLHSRRFAPLTCVSGTRGAAGKRSSNAAAVAAFAAPLSRFSFARAARPLSSLRAFGRATFNLRTSAAN
jgi:hypothetical protein